MARGRGRLREDDDELEPAPQLPPSAATLARPAQRHNEEEEELLRRRDLDDLLGEGGSAPDSEPSDAEELFDEELLQKYVQSVSFSFLDSFCLHFEPYYPRCYTLESCRIPGTDYEKQMNSDILLHFSVGYCKEIMKKILSWITIRKETCRKDRMRTWIWQQGAKSKKS